MSNDLGVVAQLPQLMPISPAGQKATKVGDISHVVYALVLPYHKILVVQNSSGRGTHYEIKDNLGCDFGIVVDNSVIGNSFYESDSSA